MLGIFGYNIKNKLLLISCSFLNFHCLKLFFFHVETGGNLRPKEWQAGLYLLHNNFVQVSTKIWNSTPICHSLIVLLGFEIKVLLSKSFLDWTALHYILLRSADNRDVSKLERVNFASNDLKSICSLIHKIDLGQYTKCSSTLWINFSSQFKGVSIC